MSEIGDLRAALKDNLKAGIRGVEVNTYASVNPNPPGLHLWPSAIPSYHRTFGAPLGLTEIEFTVQAYVAFGTNIGAQEIMDEFLGTDTDQSVAAAIEADRTLGGLCHDLMVQSGSGYGALETATGTPLLTSDWIVTVML